MPTLSLYRRGCKRTPVSTGATGPCQTRGENEPHPMAYPYARLRTRHGRNRPPRIAFVRFSQVRGLPLADVRMVCKTVGSAYVGSNPTPATTCKPRVIYADKTDAHVRDWVLAALDSPEFRVNRPRRFGDGSHAPLPSCGQVCHATMPPAAGASWGFRTIPNSRSPRCVRLRSGLVIQR